MTSYPLHVRQKKFSPFKRKKENYLYFNRVGELICTSKKLFFFLNLVEFLNVENFKFLFERVSRKNRSQHKVASNYTIPFIFKGKRKRERKFWNDSMFKTCAKKVLSLKKETTSSSWKISLYVEEIVLLNLIEFNRVSRKSRSHLITRSRFNSILTICQIIKI